MADSQVLLETDSAGNIKRVVRTYETARRAEEDMALLEEANTDPASKRYTIQHVEHIDG